MTQVRPIELVIVVFGLSVAEVNRISVRRSWLIIAVLKLLDLLPELERELEVE